MANLVLRGGRIIDPASGRDLRSRARSRSRGRKLPMPGEDRVGRWIDERIDLAHIYAGIWKDAAPTHLVDVAVFCDSPGSRNISVRH
jgi:hypothetical protein